MLSSPAEERTIFLRVGRMDRYDGLNAGDKIVGGGAYVKEHRFGAEIFNYRPFRGTLYGYVQPRGRKGEWERATINLSRLGGTKGATHVEPVLVVWVATAPSGGAFVVGWYRDATVYRAWQSPPVGSSREHEGVNCGYFVKAAAANAVLLARDERVFVIPQKGAGNFGQSNVWYADGAQHESLRRDIRRYVETRELPRVAKVSRSPPIQPNVFLRQEIERAAVECTERYFVGFGYEVESVEPDNVGWDLSAALGSRKLKLEVKGLSGEVLQVDLTPNEYDAMKKHRDSYRVCVVTTALNNARLSVFAFSSESNRWEDADGRILQIREIIAARCSTS